MPSVKHESLVDLFRDCPALAIELLQCAGAGVKRADDKTPRITAAEFADLDVAEYRADVVICLDGPDGQTAEVIIVEVQLDRDTSKRTSWPVYIVGARARFDCPVTLLVLATDDGVATWCAKPIRLDPHGRSVIRPVVLGPSQLPRVTELAQATAFPELAVLSAAAHGNDDGAEVALAALGACRGLDTPRATRYADFVLSSLGEAARHALEALMNAHKYEYQSDFARKYFAQGLAEGRKMSVSTLLEQLAQRFGDIPEPARQRVEQAELDDLTRWTRRVIPAATLADVFADEDSGANGG